MTMYNMLPNGESGGSYLSPGPARPAVPETLPGKWQWWNSWPLFNWLSDSNKVLFSKILPSADASSTAAN